MSTLILPGTPSFRAVKECFARDHGVSWQKEPMFKNADVDLGKFRRTLPNGREVFTMADYRDDETISPSVVEHWCRLLEIDLAVVHIDCGDGRAVSVRPSRGSNSEPPPNLPPAN